MGRRPLCGQGRPQTSCLVTCRRRSRHKVTVVSLHKPQRREVFFFDRFFLTMGKKAWEFGSLVVQRLKRLPAMWETWVRSLGQEDPLEKEMATHSSILAWRIPWTEELGGLQSTGRKESDTTERLHLHLHLDGLNLQVLSPRVVRQVFCRDGVGGAEWVCGSRVPASRGAQGTVAPASCCPLTWVTCLAHGSTCQDWNLRSVLTPGSGALVPLVTTPHRGTPSPSLHPPQGQGRGEPPVKLWYPGAPGPESWCPGSWLSWAWVPTGRPAWCRGFSLGGTHGPLPCWVCMCGLPCRRVTL